MSQQILLVEDTLSIAMVYATILKKAGYGVKTVASLREARGALEVGVFDLVLLDMGLPDGNGMDLLHDLRHLQNSPKCVVITADSSVSVAVEAMRKGAHDFLLKPFDGARLLQAAQAALSPNAPGHDLTDASRFEGFIGISEQMRAVYRLIQSIAKSTSTVFITGESGTGKEVCASAVHATSLRGAGPFVPLNCGAIPADLLESEVFGHLRGSFTGAINDKIGAAAAADGGTLFLDEICEMDLSLQTKLLRFLQTSTIQPVGATRPQPVDVRIICATNRDPAAEVAAGRFREDLFYRLHVIPVHLAPLRERPEDVPLIATHMLREYAAKEGKSLTEIAQATMEVLKAHPWPGNVRQLLNVMRNVVALHDGPVVTPGMLPPDLRPAKRIEPAPTAKIPGASDLHEAAKALAGHRFADIERAVVDATLDRNGGSVPKAAAMLGLSPSTLYRKIEAWKRR